MSGRALLIAAAVGDVLAALAHLAAIVGGVDWYRFMGAGPRMARMVERGLILPHLYTLAIATVLAGWAIYALSGAGIIGRVPLLRTGLIAISVVCIVRGLMVFGPFTAARDAPPGFWVWSSLIVLALGLLHAVGTWRMWEQLR